MRNYKFRLYPTKAQTTALKNYLNDCRLVYNKCLEYRIKEYEQTEKYVSKFSLDKELKNWEESKRIYSQVAQEVNSRNDLAFRSFFRRLKAKGEKAGFPRFKGYDRYDSFCYKQYGNGCQLKEYSLRLSKIGEVKIKQHRELVGTIKTCSVKRENDNEWYAVFAVEEPKKKKRKHKNNKVVAYDLGVKTFAVSSEAEYIDNPKFFNTKINELKKVQRKYSELKQLPKTDKKKQKVKRQLVRLHKKVKNQRKDFLHKLSRKIVEENKYIIVEDLNIKSMLKEGYKILHRHISDCGWNQFTQMLTYKAEEAGGTVVKVNPYNTTQKCSSCGSIQLKDLDDRIHKCNSCGIELDRDLNAAYNILSIGMDTLGFSQDAPRSLA